MAIKLRCKREGTDVAVAYLDWPDGKPAAGAWGETVADSGSAKTFSTKCFIHSVEPVTTGARKFAEVKAGRKILDFALGWYRITDKGDTTLENRGIYDTILVGRANRALATGMTPATFESITPFELDKPTFTIKGQQWVQEEIGEELLKDWDAIYSNLEISMAVLVRRV